MTTFSTFPFLPAEDDLIEDLVTARFNSRQIAEQLGRTDTQIRARLQSLRRQGRGLYLLPPARPSWEQVRFQDFELPAQPIAPKPSGPAQLPWR